MTDTITAGERAALTLPGTIPGLLRVGSCVLRLDGIGGPPMRVHLGGWLLPSYTVVEVFGDYLWIARARECLCCDAGQVALDLTDPTGRAHAAWWAKTAADELYGDQYRMSPDAARILRLAQSGAEMPAKLILDLRNLCLHVAGLEVTP